MKKKRLYNYSDDEKEEILQILRPHLLPQFKDKEDLIIQEISKIIKVALVLKRQKARKKNKITFNKGRLSELKKHYQKYSDCIQELDEETLQFIEMRILEDRWQRNRLESDFLHFHIKADSYFSLPKLISLVMENNEKLIKLIDITSERKTKHRPVDVNKRRVIFLLSKVYNTVTGKPTVVGGKLQKFIETVLPGELRYAVFDIRYHLRELKKTIS